MNHRNFLIALFSLLFVPLYGQVFAQDMEAQCAQVTSSNGCTNMSVADCKVFLQKCSDFYDQQSAIIAKDISKTSQQKNTLSSAISGLKKKIQGLEYQISQGNVKVKGLNIQILDTQESIDKTSVQINTSQKQISQILQAIYQEDRKPVIAVLLEGNLSDFFGNVVYLENLNSRLNLLLDNTKDLQSYLTTQKTKMDTEVDQLQKTIALQKAQKTENDKNKKTQEQYLKLTEAQYQEQLQEQKDVAAKSAKIKALLFQMVGVAKAPTFGEALEIAKGAAALSGVRPAFLLAVISQESAIGRNVGQCYMTDTATGNGKKISTGASIIRIMHPTRDVPPFLKITDALGRDPYTTPVSCWITDYRKGIPYGWGGAMGPAQFIPSTWNLFTTRLTNALGKAPDPWAIKDSFTAAGMYLSDLGAGAQTSSTESKAASRYYGGSSSYASSVMNRANCIQTFIDGGTMTTYCQNLIF